MLEWWVADFFLSTFFHTNMVVHNNGNHAEQKSYKITFGEVGHILVMSYLPTSLPPYLPPEKGSLIFMKIYRNEV